MKPVWPRNIVPLKKSMLIGMLGCVALTLWANQPLTAATVVEWLIGSSVTDVGSKYNKIEDAVKRFRNNDYAGALAQLAEVKQNNPELPPAGVLMGKVMYRMSGQKVNPLIGAAGVSAVPMAARVVNKVGLESNHHNFLLMHAMGPNVAGVIGSAVAAGVLLAVVGG